MRKIAAGILGHGNRHCDMANGSPIGMFVFFDGLYPKKDAGPFPYVFTLGCLEIERP